MYPIQFRKSLLASAVVAVTANSNFAVAATEGNSNGDLAKNGEATVLEEIVVTGVRASLLRAIEAKYDNPGFSDSISA